MRSTVPGLRSARASLEWSQTDAARELVALGEARDVPVAAAASLKSLLSRWENGHAVPEPHYRTLLAELYGRTPAELGIDDPSDSGTTGAARLRAGIAIAGAVDAEVVTLWREHLATARRLDDQLGVAGAGGLVHALVEQLEHTLLHALTPSARREVAAVLTGAATLAGAQALDRAEHDEAWRHYERARTAAVEARLPVAEAVAVAGSAAVLIDIDDPAAAGALLAGVGPDGPAAAQVRLATARGLVSAAAGRPGPAEVAFAMAERALGRVTIDVTEAAAQEIELVDLHRWHGHALVTLGDTAAVAPLELALAARPRSARHRAEVHADLASALAAGQPTAAAEHARTASELATRIGSTRIASRMAHRQRS